MLSQPIPKNIREEAAKRHIAVYRGRGLFGRWFIRFIWTEPNEKGGTSLRRSERFFDSGAALEFVRQRDN